MLHFAQHDISVYVSSSYYVIVCRTCFPLMSFWGTSGASAEVSFHDFAVAPLSGEMRLSVGEKAIIRPHRACGLGVQIPFGALPRALSYVTVHGLITLNTDIAHISPITVAPLSGEMWLSVGK